MLRLRVFSLLILAAPLTLSAQTLLTNGSFEAIDEGGWKYRGENDGARGVYSEPTRPGSHTFLLELAGRGDWGVSAIRQFASVEPGDAYRLSFDLYVSCERGSAIGDQHFVQVGDATAFARDLGLNTEAGWIQRRIVFQPRDAELLIEIGVRGRNATREESTTVVDNVRLERVETLEFAEGLVRGRPIAPVLVRQQLPVALKLVEAGWGGLQRYQMSEAPSPAMAALDVIWDLANEQFNHTRAAVNPWVQQGIMPLVTAQIPLAETESILAGDHDARFQAWATEARLWGYPIVLRPWPEMNAGESVEPKPFIQAWRRVHGVFDAAEATNVLWMWSPTDLSHKSEKFYPGDDAVDIVGCSFDPSGGVEAFASLYAFHGKHFKNKAFAIADTRADPAWLDALFAQAPIEWPRLEFVTLTDANPAVNPTLRKWLDSDLIQPRLAQAEPPTLGAVVTRKGRSARAKVIFADNPLAPRVIRVRVEFWDGEPAAAGSSRVGREHVVTLDRGESRDFKQGWPRNSTGKIHVRIDATVDSAFIYTEGDSPGVSVFVEK